MDMGVGFSPDEYTQRRRRLAKQLPDQGLIVVQGAAPPSGFEAFRQTNEFY